MAGVQLPPSSTVVIPSVIQHRVKTKATWSDDWTVKNYLQCLRVSLAAAPSVSSATFKWRAGEIKHEDSYTYAEEIALEFRNHYVMVEAIQFTGSADGDPLFIGRFAADATLYGGTDAGQYADQDLTAYGLEHELDRIFIRSSFVSDGEGSAFEIDAPINFNERFERGFSEAGNRSSAKVAGGIGGEAYAFSDDDEVWTAKDIVEYLTEFYGPSSLLFSVGGQTDALDKLEIPSLKIYGQTIFHVLNEVIDRKRGLGWYLRPTATGGEVTIFTTVATAVSFGSITIPANPNVVDVAIDSLEGVINTTFNSDTLTNYGKIVVMGEPIVACFGVSFADETLTERWTDDQETDYRVATNTDNADKNDQYRGNDDLEEVWTQYKIPDDFKWYSKAGDGQNPTNVAIALTDDGSISTGTQANFRSWGNRVLRHLPIRKDVTDASDEPEYLPLIAFVYDDATARYVNASTAKGIGSIRPLDTDFGIELTMSERKNHILAKNHWDTAKASKTQPKYDYTKVIATIAVRTDTRLSVTKTVAGGDPDRILYIDVPDAELFYVANGTILNVDADGAFVRATDITPRNDVDRLRQVAAFAAAWYSEDRQSATLEGKALWRQWPIGTFLRKATQATGFTPVNSVVTSIVFDLGSPQKTTVKTNYSELDVAAAGKEKHKLK